MSRYTFHGQGFHGNLYLQGLVEQLAGPCRTFLETGTNVANTLVYVARRYAHLNCYSCEIDGYAYARARENVERALSRVEQGRVHLYKGSSLDFLPRLRLPDLPLVCWLDAHTTGEVLPLAEEVDQIAGRFRSAYVLIDDCQVPGADFVYETHRGAPITYGTVRDVLPAAHRVFYPAYAPDVEDGKRYGWCLIVWGDLPAPVGDYLREG